MPRLSDLGLSNDRVGDNIDYATMPDQMMGFTEPPQPGSYRFRFPKDLSAVWDKFEMTKGKNPGVRISAVFDDKNPLTIVQSPGGTHDNEPFETRINNAERKRGKRDDPTAPEVSDMDYLLRDSLGVPQKPTTNQGYIQAMMQHAPGKEFGADIEWRWSCNKDKDIRVFNTDPATGAVLNTTAEVPGTKGCGSSYYQSDVEKIPSNPEDPNSPKVFPLRIECACGAAVRAYPNLQRFRA